VIVVDDVDEVDDVGASIFFFFDELLSTSGLLLFWLVFNFSLCS
jgi:hypothetical protein